MICNNETTFNVVKDEDINEVCVSSFIMPGPFEYWFDENGDLEKVTYAHNGEIYKQYK